MFAARPDGRSGTLVRGAVVAASPSLAAHLPLRRSRPRPARALTRRKRLPTSSRRRWRTSTAKALPRIQLRPSRSIARPRATAMPRRSSAWAGCTPTAAALPRDDAVAASFFALAARGRPRVRGQDARVRRRRARPAARLHARRRRPVAARPTSSDGAADPFAELPAGKQKIADVVAKLAPRYDVDPRLALAVIAPSRTSSRARAPPRMRAA